LATLKPAKATPPDFPARDALSNREIREALRLRFATIVFAGANQRIESIMYGPFTAELQKHDDLDLLGGKLPGKVERWDSRALSQGVAPRFYGSEQFRDQP
jgi:hypothetical protein